MTRICVFCGASPGARPVYRAAAEQLGRELAERGIGLVYGGGDHGLMGAVAAATRNGGGAVLGIIPRGLVGVELDQHQPHPELHIVGSMHERKAEMEEAADAFCVLPGGLGTLEEVVEVLSWAQLGLHHKPIGLLDVDGYYQPFLRLLSHQVREGFLAPTHAGLLLVDDDPAALVDRLLAARPAGGSPPLLAPEER